MCGIAGVHGLPDFERRFQIDPASCLIKALDLQHHRGPDHRSFKKTNNALLGHNRLRIIDLSQSADQPFSDISGRYSIVFNGEIFNYRELKNEPSLRDFNFKTNSDTEVLLTLLIKEGKDALHKLNGFFAFAFYDAEEDEMIIARDRFGEKPLWYSTENDVLFFASESKTLSAFPITRKFNQLALAYFLQLTYIPAPQGIYSSYHKLEPGHLITSNASGIKVESWYTPEKRKRETTSRENLAEELRNHLNDSISMRMISDVPIGAFLSGGLDSSIICALAAQKTNQLKTFSVSFPEEPYLDESENASLMASHIGASHTTIPLTQRDMLESIDDYLFALDEPFADSSSVATYFLAKNVKNHVTVALSGDGADELFGGYRKHYALYSRKRKSALNSTMQLFAPLLKNDSGNRSSFFQDKKRQASRYLKILKADDQNAYWQLAAFTEDHLIGEIVGNDLLDRLKQSRQSWLKDQNGDLNRVLLTDQKLVLANDMLVKIDLMSMAHALEIRSPFLDYRVVETANVMSAHEKINRLGQKWILRQEFGHLLPKTLLNQRKKGFEIPIDQWVKGPLRERIKSSLQELIQQNEIPLNPIFLKKCVESDTYYNQLPASLLWSLFILRNWQQKQH
ncbi:MAG: asparagine synthase (glutamine-hydrolyzing) [Flavobacteriales bacterium]|nr:asparagine synthase (glutamine-hydrolyzing) [Flavobacteriales bacterium]